MLIPIQISNFVLWKSFKQSSLNSFSLDKIEFTFDRIDDLSDNLNTVKSKVDRSGPKTVPTFTMS